MNKNSPKPLLISFLFLFTCLCSFGQIKKPTLMILPSDNWCTQRYFMTNFDNQGVVVKVPNYPQAFQEDIEIGPVISKIGGLMTSLGYSLKDVEQETKALNMRIAEDNVTTSSSGTSLSESPLDILKKRTKSDIVIQIGWVLSNVDGGRQVTFTLEAFDAYTSKRIATSTGTTDKPSNDPIPVILENAIKENIKPFDKQLDNYYSGMKSQGREIILNIKKWESWDNDLYCQYNDKELLEHIQDWLRDNCVNKQFNMSDATENFAQFEQVRIPLIDKHGNGLDARGFASKLQRYLREKPFEISSKLMTRGLGEAIIIIGEK